MKQHTAPRWATGCFCLIFFVQANAQVSLSEADRQAIIRQLRTELETEDSLKREKNKKNRVPLTISGYVETYYSYDFANPAHHIRQPFVYSHHRHNEVNVNLALVRATYQTERVRADLALAAGTYMNANYAAEPGVLKNLYEAYVGLKISRKKDLWVEGGVFPSHLGFESAVGKDNPTLTRSLFADNSPYFETGAKLSYTSDNGKWFVSGLLLNGWQRIQRVNGNNTPAFGHRLTYRPNANVLLNSGSFIGNDKPDSLGRMRYFHNLYGIFRLGRKWDLTAGFDIGMESRGKGSGRYDVWYTPVLILRVAPSEKTALAARGEYYRDTRGVMIATGTPAGFRTWGYSLNFDWRLGDYFMWRLEARGFTSRDKIFFLRDTPSRHNFFVTTSLALSF